MEKLKNLYDQFGALVGWALWLATIIFAIMVVKDLKSENKYNRQMWMSQQEYNFMTKQNYDILMKKVNLDEQE